MSRAWTGGVAAGSREYTDEDVERVVAALPRGRQESMSLRTFVDSLVMDARTVRQVLSDRDGIDFVLAYDGDLVWAAEFVEETIGHTNLLRARARKELERAARRERYTATLPRRQEVLL